MRYAIVSDLHANRQAWEAVLNDLRALGAERILCLGDVVGYGPAPAAVLKSVYAHVHHLVAGNHDAALCGRLDPANFNDHAQAALAWTASHLDGRAQRFLRKLPLVLHGDGFRCVHGSPADPGRYTYIIEEDEAQQAFAAFPEPLCFVGHSHLPRLFVLGRSGQAHSLPPQDFAVEQGKRYIVNVGSVGQPRDAGILASYCLYDADRQAIFFRQVAFAVDDYRREFEASGLPPAPCGFLDVAAGFELPPVREQIDFAPPEQAGEAVTSETIDLLRRRLRRWQRLGLLAAALALLAVAAIVAILKWHPGKAPGTLYARSSAAARLDPPELLADALLPPEAIGQLSKTNRLQWWSARVADAKSQSVAVRQESGRDGSQGEPEFVLLSGVAKPISLFSPVLVAPANSRFQVRLQFRVPQVDSGFAELLLVQQLPGGTQRILARREPLIVDRHRDAWTHAAVTVDKPLAGGEEILFLFRTEFVGELRLRKCQLVRAQ